MKEEIVGTITASEVPTDMSTRQAPLPDGLCDCLTGKSPPRRALA